MGMVRAYRNGSTESTAYLEVLFPQFANIHSLRSPISLFDIERNTVPFVESLVTKD